MKHLRSILSTTQTNVLTQACDLSTHSRKTKKFKASLGYTTPCLKNKRNKEIRVVNLVNLIYLSLLLNACLLSKVFEANYYFVS